MKGFFSKISFSFMRTSCNVRRISATDVEVYSKRSGNGSAGGTTSFGRGVGGLGGSSILSTSSDFMRWTIDEESNAVPDAEKSM